MYNILLPELMRTIDLDSTSTGLKFASDYNLLLVLESIYLVLFIRLILYSIRLVLFIRLILLFDCDCGI